MILSAFEHKFLRAYNGNFSSSHRKFLLGVSGGIDSLILLHLINKFENKIKSPIRVCHVHHGNSSNVETNDFRASCLEIVKNAAEKFNHEFVTNKDQPNDELKSESQLRLWRYSQFDKIREPDEILVLGHHLDDLLESQLMDLVRGSHFQSWTNYKEFHNGIFRPLSQVSKQDLLDYALENSIDYINDPSNLVSDNLRNLIRNDFLHKLEHSYPGSKMNLLNNINKLYGFSPSSEMDLALEIVVLRWHLLSDAEKRQFVLNSVLKLGLKSMTGGQISDTVTKLDLDQKQIKFQTGPIIWDKTTDKITAYRSLHEKQSP